MFRVIYSLSIDERVLQHIRDEKPPPGLLVTIDAEQPPKDAQGTPKTFVAPGSTVRVHRPDGTSLDRLVTGVEIWGQHVGLFFANTAEHEIPISSEIELPT
jgi:hypothetical protein